MDTINNERTTEFHQKEAWNQPELIELDINKTESGEANLVELSDITGSLGGS
jgi:hypothetical protein